MSEAGSSKDPYDTGKYKKGDSGTSQKENSRHFINRKAFPGGGRREYSAGIGEAWHHLESC